MTTADEITEAPQLPARIEEQTTVIAEVLPLEILVTPQQAVAQVQQLQALVRSYLRPKVDFGKMPGTDKDALFKSGADKLCEIYGFRSVPRMVNMVEMWDRTPPLFDYTFEVDVINRRNGQVVATGVGSCNSYESKYKWRKAGRECPNCGKDTILPSKKEWGGGFYCAAKNGGCGSEWKEFKTKRHEPTEDEIAEVEAIREQGEGRKLNDDIASCKNTVLKMAKKRALVDAVISATRSAGIFTQDVNGDLEDEAEKARVEILPDEQEVWQPSAEDWKVLRATVVEKGVFTKEQFMKFTRIEREKGRPLAEVFTMAQDFFLSEEEQNADPPEREPEPEPESIDDGHDVSAAAAELGIREDEIPF